MNEKGNRPRQETENKSGLIKNNSACEAIKLCTPGDGFGCEYEAIYEGRWQGQTCDSCKIIDCPKNTTTNCAGLLVCMVCGWHRLGDEPDDNSYCVFPDPKTGKCEQPRQVECRDSLDPKCPMVYAKREV